MFELIDSDSLSATIKVIGIGGAGGNIVDGMVDADLPGVELVALNTDASALSQLVVRHKIQIGAELTSGLGAGASPAIGHDAAEADTESITEVLAGADLVILIAGLGGGTGTGAAPVVAKIAQDLGILCVGLVGQPFSWEGRKRAKTASAGIDELLADIDALVAFPSESILRDTSKKTTVQEAFQLVNDAITQAAAAIIELIVRPGLINIDFADIRTVLAEGGLATVGVGSAESEDRANEAAKSALSSSFIDESNLSKAHAVLVNVTAGHDLSLNEFQEVGRTVQDHFSDEATIVIGTVIRPEETARIHVTVFAIGLDDQTALNRLEKQPSEDVPRTPTVIGRALPGDDEPESNVLEIPAFLRRQIDDPPRKTNEQPDSLRIVASEHVSHEEIADLVMLLSDVYESVSTDRLKISRVTNLPPGGGQSADIQSIRNRSVQ